MLIITFLLTFLEVISTNYWIWIELRIKTIVLWDNALIYIPFALGKMEHDFKTWFRLTPIAALNTVFLTRIEVNFEESYLHFISV